MLPKHHPTIRRSRLLAVALLTACCGLGLLGTSSAFALAPTFTTTHLRPGITVEEGKPVFDEADVITPGSTPPTGGVTFNVYPNSSCLTPTVVPQTAFAFPSGPQEATAVAELAPLGALRAGTYYVEAAYEGDFANQGSVSPCTSEVLTVTPARQPTTLTTSLDGEGQAGPQITVKEGTGVTDTAFLNGPTAGSAGGTATFNVYSDAGCTVPAGLPITVPVTDGVSIAAVALSHGTYYWQVDYSGDAANQPSTSGCGLEVLTVTPTPSPTTLTTSLEGGGQSGEKITVPEGTEVTDQGTLSGTNAATATGKVKYTVYKDSGCTQEVGASTVNVSGGSVPADSAAVFGEPGTYYWTAQYSGDENNAPSSSPCGAEVLTVGPVTKPTTLTTALSGEGQHGEQITVKEGAFVTDQATLGGQNAGNATGTVTYNVYSDSGCTDLVATSGPFSVSGGSVSPSTPVNRVPGTYYWQAEYSGDGVLNEPSKSTCGAEVLTVLQPTTTTTNLIGGGQSGEKITVKEGTAVTDQATLGGATAGTAGGTITYYVYADNQCKTLLASYSTNFSGGMVPPSSSQTWGPGTYYWQAEYSGDAANEPSKSPCGSEVLTVTPVPKPTSLSTSLGGGGQSGPQITVKEGTAVTDTAILHGLNSGTATGEVTYRIYSDSTCKTQVASAGGVPVSGEAVPASAAKTLAAGTYYWQAEYLGDAFNQRSESPCGSEVETVAKTITGTVNGPLVAKAGQTVLLTSTAKINGPVTVEPGGSLDVEGATITGPLNANKAVSLRLCGAKLSGPGAASNGSGKVVIGEGTTGCPGNTISGPLTVTNNAAGVLIDKNTIGGSLTVTGNAGGTTVINNTVAGNLTVTGNSSPVVDKPNTVKGKSTLQ